MNKTRAILLGIICYFSILPMTSWAVEGRGVGSYPSDFAPAPAPKPTHRLRDTDIPCGVYLARAVYEADQRRLDDTVGEMVATLNAPDVRKYFDGLQGIKPDGMYVLAGVPMFQGNGQLMQDVRGMLEQMGWGDIPVRAITRPSGEGTTRIVQEALALLPRPHVFQQPVPSEVAGGVAAASMGELVLFVFSFSQFDATIAVPMVLGSYTGNLLMATGRRSMSNWIMESRGRLWEIVLKEAIVSTLFGAMYYGSFKMPEIAQLFRENGLGALALLQQATPTFFKDQWVSILSHAFFFTSTFAGTYKWEQQMAQTVRGNADVRRTTPAVQGTLFLLSTPLFAWAANSEAPKWIDTAIQMNYGQAALAGLVASQAPGWVRALRGQEGLTWFRKLALWAVGPMAYWAFRSDSAMWIDTGLQMNGGQVGMLVLAATGASIYIKPTILNPTVGMVDSLRPYFEPWLRPYNRVVNAFYQGVVARAVSWFRRGSDDAGQD
ncbi:hypothetical protein K2X33_11980 [bacterium]|nr:hypothetical protein [bacterium]